MRIRPSGSSTRLRGVLFLLRTPLALNQEQILRCPPSHRKPASWVSPGYTPRLPVMRPADRLAM